jgi:hypothetical protein
MLSVRRGDADIHPCPGPGSPEWVPDRWPLRRPQPKIPMEVRRLPPANAARNLEPLEPEDAPGREGGPVPEQDRPQQRFKVVRRRPLLRQLRQVGRSPLQRNLMVAALPTACLLIYVMFWVLAMRGGYYRDQLRAQIDEARHLRGKLLAEKLQRQSPNVVLDRAAKELGMQPAPQRDFARVGGKQ